MFKVRKGDCINKCIYSLVQAVRQFYKKAVEVLKKFGFIGGNVNPCLYVKKSEKGIVYVVFYVYNNLMTGDLQTINNPIIDLKENGLVLKVMEEIQDYLSCEVKFSKNKKRACLGKPHLIKNLVKFGNHVKNI